MKKLKFPLADLLLVLAAIVLGFFCFLSYNFLFLGQTTPILLRTFIIMLSLGGIAFLLKILKKTSRNFKFCIICEGVFILIFVVIAFFVISPFSHYFALSERSEEIQGIVKNNIIQAEKMYDEYEEYAKNRELNYLGDLKSAVLGKVVNPSEYYRLGFEKNINDSTQMDNKKFTLHAKLFPSNFAEKKSKNSLLIANAKNTLENWNPFTAFKVVTIVNEVSNYAEKWLNELKGYSSFRAKGEATHDFNYAFTFNDIAGDFEKLGIPTMFSISLAIVLYLVMLLPYFTSKRHPKFPGFVLIFGKANHIENEWNNKLG
jgi:hypothetical protein